MSDLNNVDLRVLVVGADPLFYQDFVEVMQFDNEAHQADILLPPGWTNHHGPAAQLSQ